MLFENCLQNYYKVLNYLLVKYFVNTAECTHFLKKENFHCFIQTKTYDSVTDKFMDFSFEKVTISFIYFTLFSDSHIIYLYS